MESYSADIENEKCVLIFRPKEGRKSRKKYVSQETTVKFAVLIALSHLEDTESEDECILRLKCKNKEDITEFVEYAGEKGDTNWNVKRQDIGKRKNIAYTANYECNLNGRRQKPEGGRKRKRNKAECTNCEAELHTKILKPTIANLNHDKYIQDYPCEIWYVGTHNHNTAVSGPCNILPITKHTKAIMFSYFCQKLTPSQARDKLCDELLAEDGRLENIQDTSTFPQPHQFYYLWRKWREMEFGKMSWESAVDKIDSEFGGDDSYIRVSPDRDLVFYCDPINGTNP